MTPFGYVYLHEYTSAIHVGVETVAFTPMLAAMSVWASFEQIIFDDTDGSAPGAWAPPTAVVVDVVPAPVFDEEPQPAAASAATRTKRIGMRRVTPPR